MMIALVSATQFAYLYGYGIDNNGVRARNCHALPPSIVILANARHTAPAPFFAGSPASAWNIRADSDHDRRRAAGIRVRRSSPLSCVLNQIRDCAGTSGAIGSALSGTIVQGDRLLSVAATPEHLYRAVLHDGIRKVGER